MKTCSKCKVEKPLSDFRLQTKSRDGHAYYCRECAKRSHSDWCSKNPEDRKRHHRESWSRHGPKKLPRKRERYLEVVAAEGREKFRAISRRGYERKKAASPGHYAQKRAQRRAAEIQATPPWVDRDAIAAIYADAARLGLHVDHIHPLRGKAVCGLHVPWNLQLLSEAENKSKSNKFEF